MWRTCRISYRSVTGVVACILHIHLDARHVVLHVDWIDVRKRHATHQFKTDWSGHWFLAILCIKPVLSAQLQLRAVKDRKYKRSGQLAIGNHQLDISHIAAHRLLAFSIVLHGRAGYHLSAAGAAEPHAHKAGLCDGAIHVESPGADEPGAAQFSRADGHTSCVPGSTIVVRQ